MRGSRENCSVVIEYVLKYCLTFSLCMQVTSVPSRFYSSEVKQTTNLSQIAKAGS